MPNNRKARSRVKNRKKKATVDLSVQSRRRNVKMNQPIRKKPNELRNMLDEPSASNELTISKPPGVKMMAKEIQKPP